ncbi:MAG: helix-turn-helix transcriptional regulator [Sphaerochaeta sp.]|nr:helix-turn-helix transcriptional regulator [Sphaerochaeta sp.]
MRIRISDLCAQTGLSRMAIYKIEKGETKSPETETLKAIARVLEIPIRSLMDAVNQGAY